MMPSGRKSTAAARKAPGKSESWWWSKLDEAFPSQALVSVARWTTSLDYPVSKVPDVV